MTEYLVVAAVIVSLVAVGLWLSWTATRLDRVHHRIDVARATLDGQLLRRSGATLELATAGVLDPARSLVLADAAHAARAARNGEPDDDPDGDPDDDPDDDPDKGEFEGDDTEHAQSDLSQALRAVFADPDEVDQLTRHEEAEELVLELAGHCRKVVLARRFHNDAVASARVLRSRRRVRWLRLAGHAAALRTVDFDDQPPFGFGAREP